MANANEICSAICNYHAGFLAVLSSRGRILYMYECSGRVFGAARKLACDLRTWRSGTRLLAWMNCGSKEGRTNSQISAEPGIEWAQRTSEISDTKLTSAKYHVQSAFHAIIYLFYTYWDFTAYIYSPFYKLIRFHKKKYHWIKKISSSNRYYVHNRLKIRTFWMKKNESFH